jgi:hypothetical protein
MATVVTDALAEETGAYAEPWTAFKKIFHRMLTIDNIISIRVNLK